MKKYSIWQLHIIYVIFVLVICASTFNAYGFWSIPMIAMTIFSFGYLMYLFNTDPGEEES